MATLMRRTEVVTWAPILSSFSRRLPTVALARQVCFETLSAQVLHQHISAGGQGEPELIGPEGVGGGAIGKQVQLLLLDAVSHPTAGTVGLLIEGLSGVVVDRQGGDHEAGVGATGQDLGFGHHPTLSGPALERVVALTTYRL